MKREREPSPEVRYRPPRDDIAMIKDLALAQTIVAHEGSVKVNGLGYSPSGEFLISSSDDNTMRLHNALEGTSCAGFDISKYGCEYVQFLGEQYVVHASRNADNFDIRLLSLCTQNYVGFYEGHTNRVTSVAVDESTGYFATGSYDGTVRLWQPTYNATIALIPDLAKGGRVIVAYDPIFPVVAVADASRRVFLFDTRNLDNGPFGRIGLATSGHSCEQVTSLSFSPDGRLLLVGSAQDIVFVVDAMSGDILQRIESNTSEDSHPNDRGLGTSFSPSGTHVLKGTRAGVVNVVGVATGTTTHRLIGERGQPSHCLAWNPRHYQLAVGHCSRVTLWMPMGGNT